MVLTAGGLTPYVETSHRPLTGWEPTWLTEDDSLGRGVDARFEEVPDELAREAVHLFAATGPNGVLGVAGLSGHEVPAEFSPGSARRLGSAHR